MNRLNKIALLLLLFSFISCNRSNSYKPETFLNAKEQEDLLYKVGRFIAKLPKRVTHDQKFDRKYDQYYREEMKKYRIQHYHIEPDSTHYFLINRPAPSLHDKRVAIGGRLKINKNGDLVEYDEVFRTWKMKEAELTNKGQILFSALVEKGNVDEYLPDKQEDEWVEFPDSRNYFDKVSRRWRVVGQDTTLLYIN